MAMLDEMMENVAKCDVSPENLFKIRALFKYYGFSCVSNKNVWFELEEELEQDQIDELNKEIGNKIIPFPKQK